MDEKVVIYAQRWTEVQLTKTPISSTHQSPCTQSSHGGPHKGGWRSRESSEEYILQEYRGLSDLYKVIGDFTKGLDTVTHTDLPRYSSDQLRQVLRYMCVAMPPNTQRANALCMTCRNG